MKILTFFSPPLPLMLIVIWAVCLPGAHAQTPSPHPLVGTWTWSLFSGQCLESLQYRADGVLLSSSAAAVTTWRYAANAAPDAQGFYKVIETSHRSNGSKDCQGDTHDDDDVQVTRFLQLSPAKGRLIVCKTASLTACYGPLKREAL